MPSLGAFTTLTRCPHPRWDLHRATLGSFGVNSVLMEGGRACTTLGQVDCALRSTRSFWQELPPDYSPEWDLVLEDYAPPAAGHCQFPRRDDFLRAILRSGDAAAGPDGCPYECYRQLPDLSADILAQHFRDIVCGLAPPPVQALTFIPKADAGHHADNFRPLDMPDTAARLIDSAVFMCMMRSLPTSLHQAQALINTLKEAPANFLDIQDRLLDSTADSLVLLTDLAKAFERVNPGWLLQILTMLGAPHWVRQYSIHLLYGRRTLHRIQGFLLPPLSMRQGLAMGRASSVLLFCVAIDPLICALSENP